MSRVRNRRRKIVFSIIAASIVAVVIASYLVYQPAVGEMKTSRVCVSTSHDPIVIAGNGGFTNSSGVTWGSGASSDPYVIEGWDINITGATGIQGIRIYDTTAHFVIRNVSIHSSVESANSCISLYNVTDGSIRDVVLSGAVVGLSCPSKVTRITANNCTFDNCTFGSAIYIAEIIEVANCRFLNNEAGLQFWDCSNGSAHDNSVLAPDSGSSSSIEVFGSRQCAISRNTISNAKEIGLSVRDSQGITVDNNLIELQIVSMTTTYYGLHIFNCSNIELSGNRVQVEGVQNNLSWGIYVLLSSDAVIVSNRVDGIGSIFVDQSNSITAYHNSFVYLMQVAMARNVSNSHWDAGYPAGGNFWSASYRMDEFSGPGQDVLGPDGIGDGAISLDSANSDRYPLMTDPLVPNTAPKASFTVSPLKGDTSTTYTFDAAPTSDNQTLQNGLRFRWDFDGDGTWDTDWSTHQTDTHRFSSSGNYTVRLEVRDGGNLNDQFAVNITVNERDDIVTTMLVAGGISCVVGGVAVMFILRKRRAGKKPP